MSSKARSPPATSGNDPPQNKKTKPSSPETEQTSISISSLPDDLLLNCLARVSRLYYHILSRVSKRFRSIIASPELYATRSRLNRTEKCLYLYLSFRRDPEAYLFTLTRLPSRNESCGYSLETVPSPKSLLHAESSTLVAVGSDIYKIGGGHNFKCKFWKRDYSSSVSVLDCRTHTWRQAPSMGVERDSSSTATLFDGKIYVGGGCDEKYFSTLKFMEVFDLETQTWGFGLRDPCVFRWSEDYRVKPFVKSFVLEGKLYIFGDNGSVYNPEDNRWWDLGWDNVRMSWAARECHCVIDHVLYCWDKTFKWYDFKTDILKEVNGIEGLPDLGEKCKKAMVDLGGKMGFLWNEDLDNGEYCRIWCAEIRLEKRSADEIWGKVEWFDSLLRTYPSCSMLDVVSVSV
ncbi:unnamed protein product [Eruca vesicaria subsp. sativa]|uniref:F-box domain-containing protein n=1 Tax=Eruca vesicaria subsp. sativa TaxID=29727 RepID=A0ABC8JYV7_ERUVS|nr:unnamed protein product [Eruca vesicaria subsp. sativa]